MKLGEILVNYCDEHDMRLAEMEKRTGLSRTYLYALRRGKRYGTDTEIIPTITTIKRCARAMGMSFDELLQMLDDDIRIQYESKIESKAVNGLVKIPVVGRVAAGMPIFAEENIIDSTEISSELKRRGDFFGLIIRGDSMYPKIEDGDMVVVRVQENVEDGEIAVVRVNGDDATCKVIRRDDKHIYLQSINPMYMPMTYDLDDMEKMPIEIVGKVFEIRRKLY